MVSADADTAFTRDRQSVRIEWENVPNPQASDLIGLWVGKDDVDPRHAVPVHYANCSLLNPAYLSTGSGSSSFVLYNMRWDFHFKLIRGGYKNPTIVAEAPVIKNEIPNAPTGGHLALHADQMSVVVQWVSAAAYPQVVEFGPWQPDAQPDLEAVRLCAATAKLAAAESSSGSDGNGSGSSSAGWGDVQAVGEGGIKPDSTQPVTCIEPLGDPSYLFRATSFRDTYGPSAMCGYPANSVGFIDPGYIHTVVMSHKLLVPGKRYYYRYGSEEDGWSEGHSFIAPVPTQPPHGAAAGLAAPDRPPQQGITFLAFNDVAMTNPLLFNDFWADGLHFADEYGQNSSLLAAHLASGAEREAHLALLTGDLAYALGYAADWDVFGSQFEPAFTQWPMATAPGNHERDFPGTGDAFGSAARDSGGECNVPFMWRWYNAANIHRNPFRSFYSFNMGPVHFLMLDSETPSDPSSEQGRFVAADLAAVDRELTPWVVASMHRMMVAPASWRHKVVGDVDNMERLQRDFEALFLQHQVDLVIQGHEHAYARTCPFRQGQCEEGQRVAGSNGAHASVASGGDALRTPQRLLLGRRSALEGWRFTAQAGDRAGSTWQTAQTMQGGGVEGMQREAQAGPAADDQQLPAEGVCEHQYHTPAGAPVYMLSGNGGAGFTHGFPHPLPPWVAYATENVNGYLRVTATREALKVEAIGLKQEQQQHSSSPHGAAPEDVQVSSWVMDCVTLLGRGSNAPLATEAQ